MKNETSKISVVISDQDPLTRLGMKQIASVSAPGCDIYSDIDSVNTAMFTALDVSADLLVTDLSEGSDPQVNNENLLLALCHHLPSLSIVIYSHYLTPEAHTLFQNCTQVSFLSRKAPLQEIYQVLVTALSGGRYYNPLVIPERQSLANKVSSLTFSEKRVLSLLLKGHSQHQIARLLHRSIKTISAQKCSTVRKLGFKRASELFLMKNSLLNLL